MILGFPLYRAKCILSKMWIWISEPLRLQYVAVLHCIHITEPQIIPAVLTITSPLGSLAGSVYLHPPAVWQGDPHRFCPFLSPAGFLGRSLTPVSWVHWLMDFFSWLLLAAVGRDPFCSSRDLSLGSSVSCTPSHYRSFDSCILTCASVHRRPENGVRLEFWGAMSDDIHILTWNI